VSNRIEWDSNIEAVEAATREAVARGLRLAAEHLLTEANKSVPHDEGTLERSGEASVDEQQLRAAVSYDTPYAVRQHEDMSLRHDGKGRPKWLENTMTAERDTMAHIVAVQVGGVGA